MDAYNILCLMLVLVAGTANAGCDRYIKPGETVRVGNGDGSGSYCFNASEIPDDKTGFELVVADAVTKDTPVVFGITSDGSGDSENIAIARTQLHDGPALSMIARCKGQNQLNGTYYIIYGPDNFPGKPTKPDLTFSFSLEWVFIDIC